MRSNGMIAAIAAITSNSILSVLVEVQNESSDSISTMGIAPGSGR